jgi:DNA-binding NtrC family response regulator
MASRIRVLIVDDEQVVCDLLSEELTERGYLCTAVLSGQEALAKTKEERFDLVLLDVRLPGLSGMEVLRKLFEERPSFPVIMITALNDASTAVEAMKLGAYDYIVKPFDLDQVESCMRRALKQRDTKGRSLEMDAIARGVEFGLSPSSVPMELVIERAADAARQLTIPEKDIKKWVAERSKRVLRLRA